VTLDNTTTAHTDVAELPLTLAIYTSSSLYNYLVALTEEIYLTLAVAGGWDADSGVAVVSLADFFWFRV
jgi:hypothetical protein